MQWLINEFKALKAEVFTKIDKIVDDHTQKQIQAAEDIQKLKGEISALKARMGKVKE